MVPTVDEVAADLLGRGSAGVVVVGVGWRHRYWATGMPGWGRMYPPPWEGYYGPVYSQEDELAVLKEEAAWLKQELNAVEERLRELESRQGDEG